MQEDTANIADALPPVAPQRSQPSATPLTTPKDGAGPVAAASTAQLAQETPNMEQPANSSAAGPPAPASTMPPPNAQAAGLPQSGSVTNTSQGPGQQDPICGYLLQDVTFVAAVKKQDTSQAAQAAAKVIKHNLHVIMARIKPQQNAAMASILANSGHAHNPHAHAGAGAGAMGGPAPLPGYPPMMPGFPGAPPGVPLPSVPVERRLSDDGRFRRGSSCEPGGVGLGMGEPPGGTGRVRELRRGDWVIIRSANKSTDPELLGQDAWVARVEHNGWVELQVPKLGRTVKLQQRYLQLIPPQHTMQVMCPPPPLQMGPAAAVGLPPPGPPPGAATAAAAAATLMPGGPPPPPSILQQQVPPQGMVLPRRGPSEAAVSGGGMGPPGVPYMDEQGRPYKRLAMDPAVRPALPLEALPPARVAATPSRGSAARVKELLRSVRRELLAVEESVPWNCVAAAWKNVRPGWRRTLQRSGEVLQAQQQQQQAGAGAAPPAAPPQAAAPPAAGAPPPSPPQAAAVAPQAPSAATTAAAVGVAGGNDAAAAAALSALVGSTAASMLELHEALTTEKGYGLFARRGAWETRLRELADGGNNPACLQVLWAEMAEGIKAWMAAGGPPSGTPGAGAAADMYGIQTPRDSCGVPFPAAGEEYYPGSAPPPHHHPGAMPPQHLHPPQQQQPHPGMMLPMMPSPFCDYAAVAGAGRGGGGAAAAAAAAGPLQGPRGAGPAPGPQLPPGVAPGMWFRSELSVLMHALESEVDTDLDEGPDATDLEDSDSEPESLARRRRRLRRQQQQQRQQQPQLQPAEPAPPAQPMGGEAAEAVAVAGAAEAAGAGTGGPEAMDVDSAGAGREAGAEGPAGGRQGGNEAMGTSGEGGVGEAGPPLELDAPAASGVERGPEGGPGAANGTAEVAAAATEQAPQQEPGPLSGGRELAQGRTAMAAQESSRAGAADVVEQPVSAVAEESAAATGEGGAGAAATTGSAGAMAAPELLGKKAAAAAQEDGDDVVMAD